MKLISAIPALVIGTTCWLTVPPAGQTNIQRVARLGLLSDYEKFGASASPYDWLAGFRAGLRDLGYTEGKNLLLESRYANRDPEKLARMAAELAAMKVDIIVAASTTAAKAAKAATHAIPIVFWGAEPISSSLVANLDHPSENLTGVTAKVVPDLKRVAILFNRSYAPVPGLLKNAEGGARALGLSTQLVEVAAPSDLPGAFEAMKREGSHAVLVLNHGMFFRERAKLAALAIDNGIAVSTPYLPNAEAGALIAHEPDFDQVWRINASHVDKILKGANPGDLPVQRLTTFRYAINLNTAKTLGLTISASILKRAAVVIPDSAPANAEPGAQPAASESDCNQCAPTPLTTVDLPGHPFSIIPTRDGCWLFVSLTSEDPKSNGVAVLRRAAGTITLERVYPIEARKDRNPLRPGPSGMVMTHDGQLLIAANDDEVVFLDVQSMISGKVDSVAGRLSDGAPKHGVFTSNGSTENSAGSLYVNVTKDDAYLFVSDEYAATISVVDLKKARADKYDTSAIVGQIPVGIAPIALTFSPDERWLYTISQRASPSWNWPVACPQDRADRAAFPKIEKPEGAVVVVDVPRARTDPAHSVVAKVAAGCGSVRLAIAPDRGSIWVSARRSDAVLAFDTSKLLNDPLHSRIGSVPVGTAPVGIAVLSDDKHVVVANSNRIAADPNSPQNVSVIDITRVPPGTPTVTGTFRAGAFPREFSQSPDGRTLFLGNYLSNTLEVIDEEKLLSVVISRDDNTH